MDFNIRQDFSGDDYDEEAVESYTEGLFARFVRSPEAAALDAGEDDFDGFFWSNPLIQYGIDYRSVTPATMRPADFEEVLFRVFPRKVSVDASKAEEIVIELRAFWRFLQREFGLENAAECLSILDDGAIAKLRGKLADPSNFGMAKSFFAEGEEMGFDMETEDGVQTWVKECNANPERHSLPLPVLPHGSLSGSLEPSMDLQMAKRRKSREERKRKRKQAKTSRRRNR